MSADAEAIRQIAARLERAGLRAPVALLLEAMRPIDVINSQLARFGLPLAQGTGAEPLLRALADAEGWHELRSLLADDGPPQR